MKNLLKISIIVIFIGISCFIFIKYQPKKEAPTTAIKPIVHTPDPIQNAPEPVNTDETGFHIVTLNSDKLGNELLGMVGSYKNVFSTLAINRIDDRNLRKGMTLVVPNSFKDPSILEFMPSDIDGAQSINKLIIISQEMQAFGAYEGGHLVRSGPISSGKRSTPTPSKLYFLNWKGEEVVSTFSDEWILKWNFNLDNKEGIGMHYYTMPGYPASHSCVRLYENDALWLYEWGEQWILASDGQTKLANGTPVIVYGEYNFKKQAPWKDLVNDPNATKINQKDLEKLVRENLDTIQKEMLLRDQIIEKKI
jgi:lipoprotein-anchoring transpeptidase ErfK/SrfK